MMMYSVCMMKREVRERFPDLLYTASGIQLLVYYIQPTYEGTNSEVPGYMYMNRDISFFQCRPSLLGFPNFPFVPVIYLDLGQGSKQASSG